MNRKIIIGSRGSDLALWQANFVKSSLKKLGVQTEIQIIKTQGDKIQDLSFDKMEGKGFFTKEIEEALINKEIDLAVHSHKDLETRQPFGLKISAVSDREDPRELILIKKESFDPNLEFGIKENGIVGTSSARRQTQLTAERADIQLKDLRGNVPTRIEKLRTQDYDAIVLAYAGVKRLKIDLSEFETQLLDPKKFVPAPAQGVLGIQIRKEDEELDKLLQNLNHPEIQEQIGIERAILNRMEGGCQLPLGVYCENKGGYKVWLSFAKSKGEKAQHLELEGDAPDILVEGSIRELQKL
ncbi:MAG: hydroxymethylbilane synthase [Crocinitomicaceae bacterium]|nr:hydroxymethylbilane synthase [Crocinitomicaceae bacterium]